MRTVTIGRILVAAALVGVGALVGSAVVWAHGSRALSQITACVDPSTGALSIGTCRGTSLTWNADGQPGPTGPAGATGAQGIAGPAGPPGMALAALVKVVESTTKNSTPSFQAIAKCPAGMVALGGGGWPQGIDTTLATSYPDTKSNGKTVTAFGWVIGVKNPKGTNTYAHAYALCAPVAQP